MRVAFLRQEFMDELVMTRTLKEELLASFTDEQEVLRSIEQCENDLAQATDDPDKMQDILNRLQSLQEEAIAMGAYALDAKILKALDAMGFSTDDLNTKVESFSGGWKMRIGLAKILCLDP